jgi:hypothetical protein
VEDVAGAVGVDDAFERHGQRRHFARRAFFVVPDHTAFAERNAADLHAPGFKVLEHLVGIEVHLLAHALGHDGSVDEVQ